MRVYRRTGSPFFYVDLVGPEGRRRVSTRARTKREALQNAAKALQQADAARAPTGPDVTLEQALTSYVTRCRASGMSSWTDYQKIQAKTLGQLGGRYGVPPGLLVSALTGETLLQLRAARAAEGNTPGTIANELKLIRAATRHAVEQLGATPPKVVRWDLPRATSKLRYLSRAEADRLLEQLDPARPVPVGPQRVLVVPQGRVLAQRQDAYDMAVVLLLTGARWHEVAALTWGQVSETVQLFSQKTDKERSVPLTDRVRAVLTRRRAASSRALVFAGTDGQARSGPSRAITRAMDACGLNDPAIVRQFGRANIHTLRHTYASWLRQAGLGLDEIQPLLGHASIAQTQVYAKIVEARSLDRAAAALAG